LPFDYHWKVILRLTATTITNFPGSCQLDSASCSYYHENFGMYPSVGRLTYLIDFSR
jgi:hypothetical protein